MNEDGSGQDGRFRYFHAADGQPDFSHPMTKKEVIEMYWQASRDDPSSLADLYLDFHAFSQIEFLIFRDRLSSTVLVSNAARKTMTEMESRLKSELASGKYRVDGWEGESDLVFEEALSIIENTYRISIGATIVTAVAALESLIIDLLQEMDPMPRGLHHVLQAFFKQHNLPKSQTKEISKIEHKLEKRRNTFAHTLTGSYFSTDKSIQAMFTQETMEDTLYAAGKVAIAIERLLD